MQSRTGTIAFRMLPTDCLINLTRIILEHHRQHAIQSYDTQNISYSTYWYNNWLKCHNAILPI